MNGLYGMEGTGSAFGIPAAFIGTSVFDGQGNTNPGKIVFLVGGTVDPIDTKATYTVEPDCSGRIELYTVHHNPARSHYHDVDIMVVDGGKEAYILVGGPKDAASGNPPPGEVLAGTLKRL